MPLTVLVGKVSEYLMRYGVRPWQNGDGFDGMVAGYYANVASPANNLIVAEMPITNYVGATIGLFVFIPLVVFLFMSISKHVVKI